MRPPLETATNPTLLGRRSRHPARFCRRPSPRETSRSSSSRISICHSCWLRPRCTGVAVATTRWPARTERRKFVWFETPTTLPRSPYQNAAPRLALVSAAAQYTPPWTIPYGWRCSGPAVQLSTTRSGPSSSKLKPSTLGRPWLTFSAPSTRATLSRHSPTFEQGPGDAELRPSERQLQREPEPEADEGQRHHDRGVRDAVEFQPPPERLSERFLGGHPVEERVDQVEHRPDEEGDGEGGRHEGDDRVHQQPQGVAPARRVGLDRPDLPDHTGSVRRPVVGLDGDAQQPAGGPTVGVGVRAHQRGG